jgi:hypothetical protein
VFSIAHRVVSSAALTHQDDRALPECQRRMILWHSGRKGLFLGICSQSANKLALALWMLLTAMLFLVDQIAALGQLAEYADLGHLLLVGHISPLVNCPLIICNSVIMIICSCFCVSAHSWNSYGKKQQTHLLIAPIPCSFCPFFQAITHF